MAAVPEDEESLLPSGRDSEDLSRKTATWQLRQRSLFRLRGIRVKVATFMTLAGVAVTFITLWMLYVYHPRSRFRLSL